MSALPKAVRTQIEKANKLAKEYHEALNAPPVDPNAPPADPNAPAPAAPAASAEPVATPADPNAPPAAPAPAATPPQEGYEQKYKVLQGKYNAEVPRLQNQVRELTERSRNQDSEMNLMRNLLASLNAQRETAPVPAQATPPVHDKLVKDEEVREFGADLIDVMRRVVREENASLLPEIDRRVAPVAQRVDQVAQAAQQVGARVARSDQQSVLAQLESAVPNWQEMNEDQGFLEWLDQVDPYSGHKRGALLQVAYKAHDGPRVVAFFSGYLKEHAVVTPPAAPTPSAVPAPPAQGQKKLEQFVAPGTPKTGAASTQDGSGKRVWSRAEIGQFYSDVQAGRFKGTQDQRKALEADIFAAQREGRIR